MDYLFEDFFGDDIPFEEIEDSEFKNFVEKSEDFRPCLVLNLRPEKVQILKFVPGLLKGARF